LTPEKPNKMEAVSELGDVLGASLRIFWGWELSGKKHQASKSGKGKRGKVREE